jgi:hypothetical protein
VGGARADGPAQGAEEVQAKLLGENGRRLYGIEPLFVVKERVEQHEPAKLPW